MDDTLRQLDADLHKSAIQTFLRYYEDGELSFRVTQSGIPLYSTLPEGVSIAEQSAGFVQVDSNAYLLISDKLSDGYRFIYCRPVSEQTRLILRQMRASALLSASLAAALCVMLYLLMLRINRPVSRLAHEMRTPLTAMRGYAETLQNARLSEAQRFQAAAYIISESRRLSDISEKLLDMHALREASMGFQPVFIENLFIHAQSTFPSVQYTVQWRTVYGDPVLLQSLLNNLIQNAVHASSDLMPILLKSADHTISVTDCGCGMTAEQLDVANRPHKRLNRSERGIGIPMCHEIARMHGAVLHFSSVAGKGTTVDIIFTNALQLHEYSVTASALSSEHDIRKEQTHERFSS